MDSERIVGPRAYAATSFEAGRALALLEQMLRIREFEAAAAAQYEAGQIRGFLHLYAGEEAIAVGCVGSLGADAVVVSTYREHAHALVHGLSMRAVMAELFGKQAGPSRGRGGSMHLFDVHRRFYGGNAVVARGLPLALGLALADKHQRRLRVSTCLFGDGAVAEGVLHESLNLAAFWQLPVLFCCENNLHTEPSSFEPLLALAEMAEAHDVPASSVDGMDVFAVEDAVVDACAHIRAGRGPYFLDCRTQRMRAASVFDVELCGDPSALEAWRARGPIAQLQAALFDRGQLDAAGLAAIEARVADEVRDAVAFARSAPVEPVAELARFVYADPRPP
jgi:pyruvate dehydrogenase E1 component alpha subunit